MENLDDPYQQLALQTTELVFLLAMSIAVVQFKVLPEWKQQRCVKKQFSQLFQVIGAADRPSFIK